MMSKTPKHIKTTLKVATVVTISQLISGCLFTLPPAVQAVSLVMSGVSFVTTGKTISDHALSAVTQQDCAMTRALSGDEICTQEEQLPEWTVAEGRRDTPKSEGMARTITPTAEEALQRISLELILSNETKALEDLADMDVAHGPSDKGLKP